MAPFYLVEDDRSVQRFEAFDIDDYEFWDSVGHRLIATREGKFGLDIALRLDASTPPDPAALAGRIRTYLRFPSRVAGLKQIADEVMSDDLSELVAAFDRHQECLRRWQDERRFKHRLARLPRGAQRRRVVP